MKRLAITAAAILSAAVPAAAQDFLGEEFWRLYPAAPDPIVEPSWEGTDPADDPQAADEKMKFAAGLRVGYIRGRDAERGTWLVGAQARLYLMEYVAVEASIEFHEDEYMDGDVVVTNFPFQLTAMFFPIPKFELKPYALFGAGWYYTRIDYVDELDMLDSETEHTFGFHVGGGAEFALGEKMSLNADFRYIFIDEPSVDNSELEDEEWDSWEITAGLNFRF